MKKIYINGMQCDHCKKRVEKALLSIDDIIDVQVNLDSKYAIQFKNEIDNNKIIEIIEDIGFEVIKII